MINLRKYGKEPYNVAVIHGGPGAPGGMAPVARELSAVCGILEPLQMSASLEGQLLELQVILEEHGALPLTVIGHSWGAMLSFIFTAHNPRFIKKLILVGSGLYDDKYVPKLVKTRLSRLKKEEKEQASNLREAMNDPGKKEKNELFAQFGKLMAKADSFDPLPLESEVIEFQYNVFAKVWKEARELRKSGKLLELGKKINCPVTAIHGDHDPYPAEGIKNSLSLVVRNFQFILLSNCGHQPWAERSARERFFQILKEELR